jgi:hypothetical protein
MISADSTANDEEHMVFTLVPAPWGASPASAAGDAPAKKNARQACLKADQ